MNLSLASSFLSSHPGTGQRRRLERALRMVLAVAAWMTIALAAGPSVSAQQTSKPATSVKTGSTSGAAAASSSKTEPARAQRDAETSAAISRTCQNLDRARSQLQGANQATKEYLKNGTQMQEAALRGRQEIRQAYNPTLSGKTAVVERASGAPASKTTGVAPLAEIKAKEEIRRLHANGKRMQSSIVGQLSEVRRQLTLVDADVRAISSRPLSPSQDRRCITIALNALDKETKISQDLLNSLKTQRDQMNAGVDAHKIDEPQYCKECDSNRCKSCCSQKNPMSAAAGTPHRADQERNLADCFKICEYHVALCAAMRDGASNDEELLKLGWSVLKQTADTKTGVLKNITQ